MVKMTNNTSLDIIKRIFSNWTALRMAVEHGMGSKDHANYFCEYIEEVLSMNEKLDQSDIAMELEDYMDEYFNTQLEDDSAKQVADDIHRFHYILRNDTVQLESEIEKLPPLQSWIVDNKCIKEVETVTLEDSEENIVPPKMEVDSEGFSIVTRKKKK